MNEIYFATNRNPLPTGKPTDFGKHFSEHGLANLRFGKAKVDGTKVTIEVRREKLPKAQGVLRTGSTAVYGSDSVFDDMRKEMKEGQRDAIVFIHGYNVSFKEALQAAAKMQRNLAHRNDGKGVLVLAFSWPSDGSMAPYIAYSNDRDDAQASGPSFARGLLKLRDFLQGLKRADDCNQSIHLVAHSMGNYVLRNALQSLIKLSGDSLPRIFDQIFLMAADEDDDAFELEHKFKRLPRLGRQVNVYFNREDRAMSISDWTKGNPDRLGDDGPRAPFHVPGKVVQVDCTGVVSGLVEHSYFNDTQKVVDDMSCVMDGVDPQDIPGRQFKPDRNRFVLT